MDHMATAETSNRPPPLVKLATAGGVGNFLEWFDFAAYGFFAASIGRVFFPSDDPTTSLLSSLAVFGVAFVVRPLGGITVGAIGDRLGRRAALSLTVLLMGAATTLMAVLPGYDTIGIAAPILLVLLRCVQGLAAGGEWAGAASFLVEYAPRRHRALWGSNLTATAAFGAVVGCFVAIILDELLTVEELDSWGWRVPFLLATPLAAAGLYVRLRLEDTPAFRALQMKHKLARSPLRDAFTHHKKSMAIVFFCSAVHGVCFYYLATYVINFLTSGGVGMNRTEALTATAMGLVIYTIMCPLAGIVSDRVGRRPSMLIGSAAMALLAIPAFILIAHGALWTTIVGMTLLSVFEALVNVTTLVLLIEMFPTSTRMSGGSTGYNLALAAIAGPAPLIAAAVAANINIVGSAAFYMVAVSAIGFFVLLAWLPETAGNEILTDEDDDAAVRETSERPAPSLTKGMNNS
jgi:MHS family proline/betaine transporter-like MFS transporter